MPTTLVLATSPSANLYPALSVARRGLRCLRRSATRAFGRRRCTSQAQHANPPSWRELRRGGYVIGARGVDLNEIATQVGVPAGAIWTLSESEDLNANLVRFPTGSGVEEHLNDEVDVLLLGVSGEGEVVVEGKKYTLSNGVLVFAPKSARRSTLSRSKDFAYLSIHRRREGLRIGRREAL